jgi:hypothetical protein
MKRLIFTALPVAALLAPTPASACMELHLPVAMFHNALPNPLPAGAIVAEVEAGPEADDNMLYDGMRVRVRRMLQGEAAPELILRASSVISRHLVLDEDRRGLIVAVPDDQQGRIPVAWPIFAERDLGYRLPEGFQLPPLAQVRERPRRTAAGLQP